MFSQYFVSPHVLEIIMFFQNHSKNNNFKRKEPKSTHTRPFKS